VDRSAGGRCAIGLLATIVSIEVVLLTSFVLITQNLADARRQIAAKHQLDFVQMEEEQNEELLNLSTKLLDPTQANNELTVAHVGSTEC
jgi:uncharacterized membrane protein